MSEYITFEFSEMDLDGHLQEYVEKLPPLDIPYEVNTDCDGHHITPDEVNMTDTLITFMQAPKELRGEMWKAMFNEVVTRHKAIKESFEPCDPHCDY